LVGQQLGNITKSFAYGQVTSTGASVHGLVGTRSVGTVTSSFYDSTVNPSLSTDAYNVGKTTADLKKSATFTGWDIVEDSSIAVGSAYPQIRWKATGVGAGSSVWVIGPSGTPVTYTFDALSGTYTYNGNAYSLTNLWSATSLFGATYSSWALGTDYNFKQGGSTVTGFTNAGTYSSITVDILKSGFIAAGSGNTAGTFTIAKAPLTVTANNATATYNGSAYAGTPGVSYSGFVTPTGGSQETSAVLGGALAYTYSTTNPTRAATYTITPGSLTATNYTITYGVGSLTIDPKALTVTGLTAANKQYDGTRTASVSGTASISGVVGADSGNVSLSGTASGLFADANAGTGKAIEVTGLTLGGSAASDYTLTAPTGFSADIRQRPITVAADTKTKTYGNADPALTYAVTSGSLVGSDTFTGALTRTAGENVGAYTINASALATGNYLVTANDGTLTIQENRANDSAIASVQSSAAGAVNSVGNSPAPLAPVGLQPEGIEVLRASPVVGVTAGLGRSDNQAPPQNSGGLRFQEAPSDAQQLALDGARRDQGGLDPMGFMRVFVLRGGINFGNNDSSTKSN
jgi:hypothetical protein